MGKGGFISIIMVSILAILVFTVLKLLGMTPGSYIDWIIGLLSFWWLVMITVAPWNMYFKAQEVIYNARQSNELKIEVVESDMVYVRGIARKYFIIAIALHIVTAIGMYLIAFFQISSIGFIGAILAVVLTFIRPAIRLHDYVVARLSFINEKVKYPRQDVYDLLQKYYTMRNEIDAINNELKQDNPYSTVSKLNIAIADLQNDFKEIRISLKNLEKSNQAQHDELSRKSTDAIAQLSEDGRFLNQVREIVGFVKKIYKEN